MNQLPFLPHADVPTLQQAVTDQLCEWALRCVAEKGQFNISLSGGSTPKRVYELLVECELPWDKIHFFWGDERNVPHDHADSNYRMVCTALLEHVTIPESNIHPVPVNIESPDVAASEYERVLRDHFQSETSTWDLVLLGMGDDAHTASLFPHTKALANEDRLFVENWVEKLNAFRYTMTYPAIESGREIWFIITGSAKQEALRQVLSAETDVAQYPSQRIRPTRWFVDAAAVGSA